MNITFGIITDGSNDQRINVIIDSIQANNIPSDKYEIIIVGNSNINRNNARIIQFDEHIKQKWITRKKNIITQNSKFDNIVYTTDYVAYAKNWYQVLSSYTKSTDWDVLITKINCQDQVTRLWDWIAYTNSLPIVRFPDKQIIRGYYKPDRETGNWLLSYSDIHNKHLYISGLYWVAKKELMINNPLDQNYTWAQAGSDDVRQLVGGRYNYCNQDLQWSYRILIKNKYKLHHITNTYVYVLKPKASIGRHWDYTEGGLGV